MEYRMLMLGLDKSGKTTLLYKMKLNTNLSTIPTIGFNVETITTKNGVSLTVWDVGGDKKIRNLWTHYLQNTDGLIYVVDSVDRQRISESKEELHAVCDREEMRGVPLVVIANKQDLPDAMSESDVEAALNLNKLNDRKWFVQGTNVITGDGLPESMEMMATFVMERRVSGAGNITAQRDL